MKKNFREVIRDIEIGEKWESQNVIIYIDTVEEGIVIERKGRPFNSEALCFADEGVYILQQKPATFEDVVNSDKKCKVEHPYIAKNSFMSFELMMGLLTSNFSGDAIKDIIKNGDWYLEP